MALVKSSAMIPTRIDGAVFTGDVEARRAGAMFDVFVNERRRSAFAASSVVGALWIACAEIDFAFELHEDLSMRVVAGVVQCVG
jgi:hypothetical protein